MRVLFVSAWFAYPPDNGARIRTYHVIKALSREHEVFLISLLQPDSDPRNAAGLSDICQVVSLHRMRSFDPGKFGSIRGLVSNRPRSFVDAYDPAVRAAVENAVGGIRPDVIVASTLGVADYVPSRAGVAAVLDEHNCEYAVLKRAAEAASGPAQRLRQQLGWRKLARYEAAMCRRFGAVTMVSEQDARLIRAAAPDLQNVHVVPNGVDTSHYDPASWSPSNGTLIYNGSLTYGANLDAVRCFASEIYPSLRTRAPNSVLRVTGRTDGVDLEFVRRCAGVEIVGYVEDIRIELARSAACVVPLREGGGSRLKILEAMAAGVPVVSTSVGAEGIDAVPGKHLLVADTASDFADAIHRVLADRELALSLSRAARALVASRYDWSAIGRSFARIVESGFRGDPGCRCWNNDL